MFFDDAKAASQLLNLALTRRNDVPMCGIPHHAAESYIGKLLRAGRKVALCDQLEEATPGKLVERDVTQILTPGTHFDAHILNAGRNNFLASICPAGDGGTPSGSFGLALIDLTTGDFKVTELETPEQLQNELTRVQPSEIIVPAEWLEQAKALLHFTALTPHDGWTFERETAFFTLRDHFKTQSLDGFGAGGLTAGVGAAGAALHYLQQTLRRNTAHIHRLGVYTVTDFMVLDAVTQRNLELLEAPRSNRAHTLVGCLDRTLTPMGARLLREWLTHPLKTAAPIVARQDVIARFCDDPPALADFREALRNVRDMERTLGRLSVGTGNARDLVALKESLAALPHLKKTLAGAASGCALLEELAGQITELPELQALIARAIEDAPPLALKEGGLIRAGYTRSGGVARRIASRARNGSPPSSSREHRAHRHSLAQGALQPGLRLLHRDQHKANLGAVPADYTRKQTMANGERFVTPGVEGDGSRKFSARRNARGSSNTNFSSISARRRVPQSRASRSTASAGAGHARCCWRDSPNWRGTQNYCRPLDQRRRPDRDHRGPASGFGTASRWRGNSCPTTCGSISKRNGW
jgi:DNA mismatch repair protein MutS